MLAELHLSQFRNYASLELAFAPGINLLLGANGQGKTNLLEAICFLALLRSFRTAQSKHLCRWGADAFLIRGVLTAGERRQQLALHYGEQRRLLVDRQPVALASDFIGRFFAITFVPEDIELVKGAGSHRRRFLDIVASQLAPAYLTALQQYNHALKSRNALLRAERPDERAVRAFDQVLVERGSVLLAHRLRLAERLGESLSQVAAQLYPAERALTMRYGCSVPGLTPGLAPEGYAAGFAQALAESWPRDVARQFTTRGPHRDDLHLYLDGRPLDTYGSEGQCRLAVLALKMAAAQLVTADRRQESVLWLVDDVVGELDDRAKAAFFACLDRAAQVFLVATSPTVAAPLQPRAVYHVQAGTVTPA
jgi:DNA replication and repair protein RecF